MRTVDLEDRVFTPAKIVCVGKNYSDHIKEMGGSAPSREPTIFIKPNSAIASRHPEIYIPEHLGLLHHEVELCFIIGNACKDLEEKNAVSFIAGYAVGTDLTLRARQAEAKKDGGPWTLAKGFDNSAVFGPFVDARKITDPRALDISLSVNGKTRQRSNTREMLFLPAEILSFASCFMTIEEGDIFMCGTPSGVGEVKDGDEISAEIASLPVLTFRIKR